MLIDLLVVVLGFTIAFLIEARHDHILAEKEHLIRLLIDDKLIKQEEQKKAQWHRLDWFYLVLVSLVVAWLFGDSIPQKAILLVTISTLKILVFNIRLNILLNQGWSYLSGSGFEGKFKGKEIMYYAAALVLFIISILGIIILN